jgi:hypothetical protein
VFNSSGPGGGAGVWTIKCNPREVGWRETSSASFIADVRFSPSKNLLSIKYETKNKSMKASEKIYKIRKTKSGISSSTTSIFEGTLEHLKTRVFGYTLECGNSWNSKINRYPKTINSLVTAINKSYNEIEGGYSNSYVELIK